MEGGHEAEKPVTSEVPLVQAKPDLNTPTIAGPAPFRFVFVDGLRGLAALAIVIFHIWLYEPEPYPVAGYSHWLVDAIVGNMRVAVQILLVISGFVVAYTLRNTWVTPREIYWFLARRCVRLVPPYWMTIAVIIVVDFLCQRLWNLSSPFNGPLSPHRVSAHLTMMQDVLGHEPLSAGVWTICIEMQFYIVAILFWGLAQRIISPPVPKEPKPSMWGLLAIFTPPALISLFYWRALDSTDPYVIHFMWMFFLGMVTWWTLDRTVPLFIFVSIVAIAAIKLVIETEWWTQDKATLIWYQNITALITALAIYAAGRFGKMQTWLNWSWLQYVGRISYSLYLIHFPVCHILTTAGWKWCNDAPTRLQADAILVSSLFASIAAAQIVYWLVETPANNWAARMKRASSAPRKLTSPDTTKAEMCQSS